MTQPDNAVKIKKDSINVVYCTDNKYILYMAVSLTSLILNNLSEKIAVHIIYGSDTSLAELEKIQQLEQKYANIKICLYPFAPYEKECQQLLGGSKNWVQYMRLYIDEILPEDLLRIIYIDADSLCVGNINAVAFINLRDRAIGAVSVSDDELMKIYKVDNEKNVVPFKFSNIFLNAGFLLVDMDKYKRRQLRKKIMTFAQQNDINNIEEAVSCALNGEFYHLDGRYNRLLSPAYPWYKGYEQDIIWHFCGDVKPWQLWYRAADDGYNNNLYRALQDVYFVYADEAPCSVKAIEPVTINEIIFTMMAMKRDKKYKKYVEYFLQISKFLAKSSKLNTAQKIRRYDELLLEIKQGHNNGHNGEMLRQVLQAVKLAWPSAAEFLEKVY